MQAPEPDVEGVVLHVDDSGAPTAVVCHGQGSFNRTLREFGEPLTILEPNVVEDASISASRVQEEVQPEAATV